MCTVATMMRRFERLDVRTEAAESMRDTKKDFLEWQKEQLFAGKKSNGAAITPAYHPYTVFLKKVKGQPYDRVTLKDTGFFHESLFLVVYRDNMTYTVTSTDIKAGKLIGQYGPKILGLGGIFKIGYQQDLRPVFLARIRKRLSL